MKKTIFTMLAGLLLSLLAQPANAIVEIRATYTVLGSSPSFTDLYGGPSGSVPSVVPMNGLGFDALVFIPLTGWGFGLRQENLGLKADSNGVSFDAKANRTAGVATYRFINTLLHVGVVGTYGLSHTSSMDVGDTGNSSFSSKWEPDSATSYSAGLDVGVGLIGFVFGGEAGYESLKWNKMKDSTGHVTNTPDTDMSGTYMKLYLGFGF